MRDARRSDETRLADADAARRRPDDPAGVLETYLTVGGALDPRTDIGRERLAWTFSVARLLDRRIVSPWTAAFRALRTSEDPADVRLAERAGTAAAIVAMSEEDVPLAEAILEEVLPQLRGTGSRSAVLGFLTLAQLRIDVGRHFEALVLARHAHGRALEIDETTLAADALSLSAVALAGLGDADAADAAVTAAERLIAAVDSVPTDARHRALDARSTIAQLRGDLDLALEHMQELVAASGDTRDETARDRLLRATHLLADLGRISDAEASLARARDIDTTPPPHARFALAYEGARIAAARADGHRALTFAREALAILERHRQLASLRLDAGARLARLLASLGRADAAARALDVHASLLVEQIVDVDSASQRVPEIGVVPERDRRTLLLAHARYIERERDTLAAIARLLEPALHEGAPWTRRLVGDDGTVRICAWCSRTESADGRWLPLGHLVPRDGPVAIRHGMCPECLADTRQRGAKSP